MERFVNPPKTLVLSLAPPAQVYVSSSAWYPLGEHVYLNGQPTEENDTPWNCLADLLVDLPTRSFVGLAFRIDDVDDQGIAREVVGQLNPEVARYTDVSGAPADAACAGQPSGMHRCDVLWAPSNQLSCERGELCFGEWAWLYQIGCCDFAERDVLGVAICDIEEILTRHGLRFPEVSFPPLRVEFVE